MRIQADGTRILTPEEQEQEFEKWFQCKKDNYEVWGNGDDFWVEDEIQRFCKLGYEQGLSVLKAVANKAYCEKANAEIQLDKAKEMLKCFLIYEKGDGVINNFNNFLNEVAEFINYTE